jgi:hypothetical protein
MNPCIETVERIVSNAPELQSFHDNPPGHGMAVIYAGVCKANQRIYVGKHVHGKRGRSVRFSRWKRHERGQGGAKLLHRAICKYGASAIWWAVIDRVPEATVSEREKQWVVTLNALGRHGLNLHEGGEGGCHTASHRANIKAGLARADVKSRIATTNSTDETRKKRRIAAKEVANRSSVRDKRARTIAVKCQDAAWLAARSQKLSSAQRKAHALKPEWVSKAGLEAQQRVVKLRRADTVLESARKREFSASFEAKRRVTYNAVLQTDVLPWPKDPKERVPRPQYYRRDGKIGFSSGSSKRFQSIEQDDWKSHASGVAGGRRVRGVRV